MSAPNFAPNSQRLTVVQLLPALDAGGVERGTLEVAAALVERNHRSIVISRGGRLLKPLLDQGSEHITLPVGEKSLRSLLCRRRLRELFTAESVQVVHARSRLPAWLAYSALRPMSAAVRPSFVTTIHGFYSVNRYSAIMTRGDQVTAVSESAKRYVEQNYPGADAAAIEVIQRGVDTGLYRPGVVPPAGWLADWFASFPQLRGKQVITLPGRITRLKGHRAFIRVIARLRRQGKDVAGLIVGGEDPRRRGYAEALRATVAEQQLGQHVLFTENRDDLRYVLAMSDVVLSLSEKPEAFGRTVLEALSLGIPVVGYAHGGVAEVLAQMFPAGGVGVGDEAAVAEKIAWVLRERPQPVAENPFKLSTSLSREIAMYERLHARHTTQASAAA
ncbi:glycosyltransferase [Thiosocius teredinicola]|uniref:glycosyltransferase n=1 Tax=Thiosocius teredinicola TaxID=1973002 RepID=UPI000990BC21